MIPQDSSNPNDEAFDRLDEIIRKALIEEGAIIPKTVEEVRQANARLKAKPVTVPPHLHDPAVVLNQIANKEPKERAKPVPTIPIIPVLKIPVSAGTGGIKTHHKKGSIFFRRAAFDAYVIHTLADDENLGRTKIEKITHLTEFHCEVDFEREPVRDAAGPVDYVSRRKVESLAKKQGWYSTINAESRLGIKYVPGPKILDALPIAKRTMGIHKSAIDALIELMRPLDTTRCEIIATLYAAWNDLLLAGNTPTDEKIMHEARENWHPRKLRIPLERWKRALDWMREQHLVPRGTGKPVPPAN
jgi:hypothetical protein